MCESCWGRDPYDDDRWEDDEDEQEEEPSPFDGYQYRSDPLADWVDVNPGQMAFTITGLNRKVEFRKKPELTAKITSDYGTVEFEDIAELTAAVQKNVQNGHKFTVVIDYK